MTRDEIRRIVLSSIESVAPEAQAEDIDPGEDLREALDIDSMDFLNFVTALHEKFHVDIPESDYPKLQTLDACVAYFAEARKLAR